MLAYMRQAGETPTASAGPAGGRAMIRLAWRQFRTQAAVAFGALGGARDRPGDHRPAPRPPLRHDASRTCAANGDCDVGHRRRSLSSYTVPADALGLRRRSSSRLCIGVFWGAPLIAREFETGTYRLAWTQSVTRTRWLAVKLGVVGLASIAVAGLLSLMVTWWSSPIDRVNADRFRLGIFAERDIVPIGYAAFAFALGVTAGLLIRRTLPAMAATLVAFVGARWR